ncbi:hypothetical protein R1sor_019803 [Riccia sorocarpa]|uniref:Amino acid transporter transmembrane domain-containing protein n=1 Tax=Riccia sorocarpa TaxID=122646 RepID=A0ABD3IE73_9MARC
MTGEIPAENLSAAAASGQTQPERVPLLPTKKQDLTVEADDGYHQASFSSAVFNLSTTIVGAGIMALPATMKVLGLPLGLLAIIISAILTERSLDFLIRFSKPIKARSYGGLMADSFGKVGKIMTQLCIIVNNIGVLIVYLIIIGDVLSGARGAGSQHTGILVELTGGPAWWNSRIFVLAVTTMFILTPLACFRHVDSLKHSSALSVGMALVFVVITTAVAIKKLFDGTIAAPRLVPNVYDIASFWRLFTVVPVMVTAYICHHNLHPIANEMKGSSTVEIHNVSRASITLCSAIYLATALFGYLLFGENTSSDILANFDADLDIPYSKLLCDIIRISYAVHIMLVFPLLNFSLRLNLDSLLFPKSRPLSESSRRFSILTAILITTVFVGSTLVPNIWVAFEFTGSTATVLLGFIFPGLIALRDASNIATSRDKVVASVMVVIAVISSVAAIATDVIDLYTPAGDANQPKNNLHGIYSYMGARS